MSTCSPDSSFAIYLTDSDGEEFLSPPAAAAPVAAAGAAAAARPDPSLQQGQHQEAAAGDAMARTRTRRSNATVSTPAGRKAGAAGGRKAAPPPPQQAASAAARETRGRKRATSSAAQAADEEQENRQVQNEAPAGEGAQPQKRQRRGSAAAGATPAAPAVAPAAGGRQGRTRGSAGKQQQQPKQAEQQHQEGGEATERRQAAAAAAAAPEPQQQQAAVVQRRQPQPQQPLASQGPQPSQSLHGGFFSPSPKSRARPSDSNARQSLSIAARPSVMPELRAAAAEAAAAAAAVEQGAVDQPVGQQAQQAEPAAAAAAVEPEAAAGEPSAAAQQAQQQQGAAGQAAAAFERTGSSPLHPAGAKRQRTSPRRSPPKPGPADSGRPSGSVRFNLPPVQEGAAAAAGGSAEAAADDWWDPLDPEKVKAVKQALHISSYAKGTLPLCREKQAGEVAAWLQRQMAAGRGGTMYLSGPPGTGKSLTAHEVVRQCWRPAPPAAAGGEPGADAAAQQAQQAQRGQVPPPALISINCMSLTDPQQVVERILLGYSQACAAPHPEAAEAAGHDPIVYPAAEAASGGAASRARRRSASDPLQQLQRLLSSPLPGAAGPEPEPEPAAARGGRGRGRRQSGGRGQKRKSAGGGAGAAAAAAGAGERGWLVVILDELDSLLSGSNGEELVEGLFVLAHAKRSRLLLLGIANSIDLVQQLLLPGGALQRNNLRPQHELFPSYQKTQISRVLHQRLESLPGRVFQPNAIEFCCRKMMNGNGDMRLALEACALAAEMAALAAAKAAAEAAAKAAAKAAAEAAGGQGSSGGQGGGEGGGSPTSAPPKFVGMAIMAQATNTVCGGMGASKQTVESLKSLPPQQQLMMVALGKLLGDLLPSRGLAVRAPAAMPTPSTSRKAGGKTAAASRARASFMSPANSASSRKSSSSLSSLLSGGSVTSGVGRSREVLLGQWEEAFVSLCRQVGTAPYTDREFGTACDNLKEMALIQLDNAREPKRRRVVMRVSEDDIILALSDVPVICKAVA